MVVDTHGFEHVERAAGVDVEVGAGVGQRRRDRDLPGEMEDGVLVGHVLGQRGRVSHVLFDEGDAVGIPGDDPLEVPFRTRAAEVVEQGDVPAVLDQVDGGVDAQEAGSPGDQDPPLRPGGRRLFLICDVPRVGIHRGAYLIRSICP